MIQRLFKPLKTRSFFLFGGRGTGKTFWLKSEFPSEKAHWFNLLEPQIEAKFQLDPQSFLEILRSLDSNKEWVVIDEVQKVPELLDIIHLALSEALPFKFILTGSSARKLKRGGANLLAGRASVYHLFPLLNDEWGESFNLANSLRWGDLPELLHLNSEEEKKEYLLSYSQTYLKEEIQVEQIVRKLSPFRRFLEVSAQMNGKPLNYSKIARDIGIDSKTVQSFYQVLEDTLIGFFLPGYHKSIRKQARKQPKFYFFDLGVTSSLSRTLDLPVIESTQDFGNKFEHFIIKEIVYLASYLRLQWSFSYLLTKDDGEIDLIIDRPGNKDLFIEIKSAKKVDPSHLSYLKKLQSEFPDNEYICLSREEYTRKYEGITIFPWQKGLKQIFGET